MITEDVLRKGILSMRRDGHQVACAIAMGASDRFLVGDMFQGLPVVEWPFLLPEGAYLLVGAPVAEP